MKNCWRNITKQYHPILRTEFKKTFPSYILAMFVNGVQAMIHFAIPAIIGQILDLLLKGNASIESIMLQAYFLIGISAVSVIPRGIYRALCFRRARISDTDLRKEVVKQLQYVKPDYYEKEDKGRFLSYLASEVLLIRKFLGNFFFRMGTLALNPMVVLIIIAIQYTWIIPLAVLPVLVGISFYIFKLFGGLKKKIEEARVADIELSRTIEQNTSGFLLIKLYNEQKNQIKKFKEINKKKYQTDYDIGVQKNRISNGVNIMYGTVFCIVFGLGLFLINNHQITVGELTAIITCMSFVISEITASFQPIMDAIAYFKLSTNRFNYFFNLESYSKEGKQLERIEKIEIKELTYSYDNQINVLQHINMQIGKGEKIGIIGQVASGKTTLMNILSGFLEIDNGQVFYNDIDINDYQRNAIFKQIGYATQKNIILDDSIENNINIKKREEVDLERLAMMSDLYPDILEMDDHFQTHIGEKGNRLSGGQKQRVQIARSLSQIRSVNIFDDTLSALDIQTEEKVMDSIIQEVGEQILIVISNKVSSMEKMDKVYVLIEGKIQAEGTHAELLETNQLYKEMYEYEKAGEVI